MPTYPQKENWEIKEIVVPPKSMGGNLCILFKAQDDEAKRVFMSCSKSKREAKRMIVFNCVRICHL